MLSRTKTAVRYQITQQPVLTDYVTKAGISILAVTVTVIAGIAKSPIQLARRARVYSS